MATKKLLAGDIGEKVAKLHERLAGLGLTISPEERKRRFFGPSTRTALLKWQKENGLEPSGSVDAETARRMGLHTVDDGKSITDPTVRRIETSSTKKTIAEKPVSSTAAGGTGERTETRESSGKPSMEDAPGSSDMGSVFDESRKAAAPSAFLSEGAKKRLKNMTLGVAKDKQKARMEALFAETNGDFNQFIAHAEESKEFDSESLQRLTFNNELSQLFEDQEGLVGAFVQDYRIRSLSDIALNYKKKDLKTLIRAKGIPESVSEGPAPAEEEERLEQFASRVEDRLFRMAPTAVIHRMVRDKDLAAEDQNVRQGLLAFFDNHPELDFRKTSVLKILQDPDNLKAVPEGHRPAVTDHLKVLQRLSAVSTKAEALPSLMKAGLDSAYAINEIPYERFVAMYAGSLGGETTAKQVHRRAQAIMARNERALISLRDEVLSPSVNMVHAGLSSDDRVALAVDMARQKNIPVNMETLFGSVDFCECKHCNSVYSPAAYLVELFQFLRNNNLDPDHPKTGKAGIKKTPLQKLFRRRPDLGRLQLTCENTNTLIPYIDLVNEVLESFVRYLNDYKQNNQSPKQAKIRTFNVEDESSSELLAEPQHTRYHAYRRLSKAVYPACRLPYHQPVDATRKYLKSLGTSRWELFSTFRKDETLVPDENASNTEKERLNRLEELTVQAVDRTIAAEYHEMVEEEYVILTREGFHTREWYELKNNNSLTELEYREKIGLKDTWEYYGIDTENRMLSELKWVKPAQESGMSGFLRRVNLDYVDLVELLKTRFINPNYPSGKARAFFNSLPYSYRFLQTMVDQSQAGLENKYRPLIEFLQSHLAEYGADRFDKRYVACWVYSYFVEVGKLVVLENSGSLVCRCVEGNFRLKLGDQSLPMRLNDKCEIYYNENLVGELDPSTGKLNFDGGNQASSSKPLNGVFIGNHGEGGVVENGVLTLTEGAFACSPSDGNCNLATTQLKHLDGTDLVTSDYDRLHRFIRLWCKLDWTMADVDRAIIGVAELAETPPFGFTAFNAGSKMIAFHPALPPDDDDEPTSIESFGRVTDEPVAPVAPILPDSGVRFAPAPDDDDGDPFAGSIAANPPGVGPIPADNDYSATPLMVDPEDCEPEAGDLKVYEMTPLLIEQLVAIKELQAFTGLPLDKLLTFWAPIGTESENALYRQLFLKYNLVAEDDVFLKGEQEGTYLTGEEVVDDHLPALMAAFKVDVSKLQQIASFANLERMSENDPASKAKLQLANVSEIYRHILLAKSLGLPIKQLPAVFRLLQDEGHPFARPSDALAFYQLMNRIDESGFDIRVLNYLVRDEDDPDRPLQPDKPTLFRLAIELRNALLQIDVDHADIVHDEEATEDLLREKLSLLFEDGVVEKVIGLVQGTTVYVDTTRRRSSATLPVPDQDAINQFFIDERKQEEAHPGGTYSTFLQKVLFSGTNGLQVTGILSDSDQDLLRQLGDMVADDDERERFLKATNKMLAQPEAFFDDALATIFPDQKILDDARAILLAEDIPNDDGTEFSAVQKRVFVTQQFLPYLRRQLHQRQVIQILASHLELDQDLARRLVMEIIETDQGDSVYQEILHLKEQKDPVQQDPGQTNSWQGYLVPEMEGNYEFLLMVEGTEDSPPQVTLMFEGKLMPWTPSGPDAEDLYTYQSKPLFLKGGQTYSFQLQGYDEDTQGNIIDLFFKFNDQPQTAVSDKHLFPALRTENFIAAYLRLHKAALLVNGFSMELKELELFLNFPESFQHLDFNALSFPQWRQLEAFYRLKKTLPKKDLTLVDFFQWRHAEEEADLESPPTLTEQIVRLTGWDGIEVEKLIEPAHFNLSQRQSFQNEKNLLLLQRALAAVRRIGLDIDQLFAWGKPPKPPKKFRKTRKIAGAIREALRSRYQQDEWEEVIRPIQDELRENQKQALIAYLLAQPVLLEWGVRDADGLFEFFLIDVQMDACMETSRIKQAISSVQLFVQRCFLGLEKDHGVHPKMLDRTRWEWMSHYRVWEANRKVFLYPENWIRGELRDDKSPFFRELESELLQNDISDEAVKSALTKYIVQVDEVANIEVLGQYLEGDTALGKLHVIGRTRDMPQLFFYRSYEYDDENWNPWEKIEIDIPSIDIENNAGEITLNGAFAIPLVWKNRLFVFFPQFVKKYWKGQLSEKQSISDRADAKIGANNPLRYWEIKLGWSEYKEGTWTPKNISNQAIYSLFTETESISSNILHSVSKGFSEANKFVFMPVVMKSEVIIRIFYLGTICSFEEQLKNEKFYQISSTECQYPTRIQELDSLFRFSGGSITISNVPPTSLPEISQEFHFISFHHLPFQGYKSLLPIWEKSNEDYWNPSGAAINGSIDNLFNGIYPSFTTNEQDPSDESCNVRLNSASPKVLFSNSHTKNIIGNLRTDRLKRIFGNAIPLNADNYGGSNDAHYHELKSPYAIYHWEMLFHSVAMLAENLSKSQRFEESMKWWHSIFDPINVKDDIKKVWKFLPFRATDSKNALEKIFNQLDPNTPDEGITEWRDNPFMPHVIARGRTSAYMKWVVMKYIDNLIAWADMEFRRDSIESINRATQLYVLAGHILGPQPEFIPRRGKIQPKSYRNLVDDWDAFSNAIVDLELIFPYSSQIEAESVPDDDEPHYVNIFGFATSFYFCIPPNPKLLDYWNIVADRLFKIRHCQNIEGVFRKLNLFEPPINPALLVQAAAQGLSIGSVLNDLSTPMPNYRFNYLLARALEVTSEVKSLGNSLLSTLEKKDSESLSLLRAKHDTNIQTLTMEIRNKQLEEAEKTIDSLRENRKAPVHRFKYYSKLAGEEANAPTEDADFTLIANKLPEVKEESGMRLIGEEAEEVTKSKNSADLQRQSGRLETLASIIGLLPQLSVDAKPIGVGLGVDFGGNHLGAAMQAVARGMQVEASYLSFGSTAAGRKAGFIRQLHDRIFQANIAGQEIKQIDKQITTQEIRCQIAEKEIENQQAQIDQAKEVEEFLKTKFSSEQLYQWMNDQLKGLYYQTYSFAYDLAKKAEKVYRFDKGLSTSDFVKFGYWDSAKEGFLAGEQLYLALKRMENAYIETKPHNYEITKHISLRQVNPLALIELKELGVCEFNLAEELFDLDYPGHYKRRIKTVAVSIPCIVGPNTSLNCTLRLIKHEFRNSRLASDYPKKLEEADERFVTNPIPTTAIAVSQGQNDSGVFELSFQSERYLPFEGAGTISSWRLELPQDFRQFDYQTITDVVIHLRYTSCEGGEAMKSKAVEHLQDYASNAEDLSKSEGLFRLFSLPHEFPNQWHRLLTAQPDAEAYLLDLGNIAEKLPFFAQNPKNSVALVEVRVFVPSGGLSIELVKSMQPDMLNDANSESKAFETAAPVGEYLNQYACTVSDNMTTMTGYWGIRFMQAEPPGIEQVRNAWMTVKYTLDKK